MKISFNRCVIDNNPNLPAIRIMALVIGGYTLALVNGKLYFGRNSYHKEFKYHGHR